jgi:hypothetical protein
MGERKTGHTTKVNEAMEAGRPLPLSYLRQQGNAQRPIPAGTLAQLDRALRTIADKKQPEREQTKTRWRFIPTYGQAIEVTFPDGRKTFAKVLDWGSGGVRCVAREGEIEARYEDCRPVPQRELERLIERQDSEREQDLEDQAVRLSKFSFDDLVVGMPVEVGDRTGLESYRGRVVYIDKERGQFFVIRLFGTDSKYRAATAGEIQVVPDPGTGELP